MGIVVSNLVKSYNDAGRDLTIINDISFELPSKNSIGIIGKSGIGKSTLLHLLAGIDYATSGSIEVEGENITNHTQDQLSEFRYKNIGFIFQFHNLLSEFTAIENVYLSLLLQNIGESEAKDRAFNLLELLGLKDRVEHKPGQLSGGEQQRVAIARALINNPKILLADEPTGSLDVETGEEIANQLLGIVQDRGITLVTVTHNRELAERFDLTYKMSKGGDLQKL